MTERLTIRLWNPQQAHVSLSEAWGWIKSMLFAGHRLVLEVRPETRSDAQNRLLHSRFKDIAKHLEWAGCKRDVDVWKRLLTAAWLRSRGESIEILPALATPGHHELGQIGALRACELGGVPPAPRRRERREAEKQAHLQALCQPSKSLHRGSYAPAPTQPAPKRDYIRSEALMRAYRLIPCQHCGKDDGTVCGAHSNWQAHGKGKSIKADDNRCASLCFTCHGMLDQGSILGGPERAALWWIAHLKTVAELQRRGLWPAGVPVPSLEVRR
jgi:hypothetical protein